MILACPLCATKLGDDSSCPRCARRYPNTLGFPDFRLGGWTEVDAEDDQRAASLLAAREGQGSFAELEAYYRELLPEASDDLRARHLAHFEIEREQAEAAFTLLGPPPGGLALDLGCGMGRYVAAAAGRGLHAVGLDASLCQLVLARKLLSELGLQATLVAGEVERPPFAAETFDVITAADLLEHVVDPGAVVRSAAALLRAGGGLFLSTPNRFSLTPEPHVGVWGLGYLPRAWAERHVKRRFGVDYRMIRPFSYLRLRAALRGAFPGRFRILLPQPGPRELGSFAGAKRRLAALFSATAKVPLARAGLYSITPYFQAVGVKAARRDSP